MRQITTAEDKARKEKARVRILGALMLLLLLGSTAGYALLYYQPSTTADTAIQDTGSGWVVKFGDQSLYLLNSPASVSEVPVETSKSIDYYAGKQVYVDSEGEAALTELGSTLGLYTNLQRACYGPCNDDLPEVTCDSDLIIWRSAEQNRVYEDNNCIFIEGDMRAVDAFIYRVLGLQ